MHRLHILFRRKARRCLFKSNNNESQRNVSEVAVKDVPTSDISIRKYLQQFNLPFEEGFTCLKIKDCTMCAPLVKKSAENTKVAKGYDLFVNVNTGYFVCDRCKCSGNWNILKNLMSKINEKKSAKEVTILKEGSVRYDKFSLSVKDITDNTMLLSTLTDDEIAKVLLEFNLMNCPKPNLDKLQIRISGDNSVLYFPLYSSNSSVVGYKSYDKFGNTVTLPKSDCPGFLSYPLKTKKRTALIVANIADFFALLQKNVSIQVICLPYGVTNLPQAMLPFLEEYKKLVLWLGVDAGAWHSTINFIRKLNEKRCYLIPPTNNQISPRIAVLHNEDIEKLIADAKPTYHEYVTSFSALREDVLSEVQNIKEVCGVPWKRFPKLNDIIKGHRRGELTIITGPTGSGKTTFMSEYSLDLAMQGVNTLWGSFEIRNARLARIMLQQYAGKPLDEHLNQFNQWANEFEQLPIYFLTFHGQQKISKVMDAVEYCFYIYDIGHVIIDNVQFMIDVSLDSDNMDRFWKQDCIIQSLRSFATRCNCHVTLVIHPRKVFEGADLSMNSIFGGGKATQEADNVFIIQEKYLANSGHKKKYLQICKNRYTGDLGIMPLDFNKKRLSFSSVPKEVVKKSEVITEHAEVDCDVSVQDSIENIIMR